MKDIKTDLNAIEIINELKYYLKAREPNAKIAEELNHQLDVIILKYQLDQDKHSFASLPKEMNWIVDYDENGYYLDCGYHRAIVERIQKQKQFYWEICPVSVMGIDRAICNGETDTFEEARRQIEEQLGVVKQK